MVMILKAITGENNYVGIVAMPRAAVSLSMRTKPKNNCFRNESFISFPKLREHRLYVLL